MSRIKSTFLVKSDPYVSNLFHYLLNLLHSRMDFLFYYCSSVLLSVKLSARMLLFPNHFHLICNRLESLRKNRFEIRFPRISRRGSTFLNHSKTCCGLSCGGSQVSAITKLITNTSTPSFEDCSGVDVLSESLTDNPLLKSFQVCHTCRGCNVGPSPRSPHNLPY